jgi:tripartite-type tricarboxylate transporter receptor subunit TctC
MKKRVSRFLAVVVIFSIGILFFPVASALAVGEQEEGEVVVQTPAEFYKDKTVTLLSAQKAGGGTYLSTLIFAGFLERKLDCNVKVQEYTTGGGLGISNYLTSIEPDGLTLANNVCNVVWLNDLFGAEGVEYNSADLEYLGMLMPEDYEIYMRDVFFKSTPDETIKALQAGTDLKGGGVSPFNSASLAQTLLIYFLDLDAKMVYGYSGGSVAAKAVASGELDFSSGAYETAEQLPNVKLFCWMNVHGSEARPGLPAFAQLYDLDSDQMEMLETFSRIGMGGKLFYTSPGVPQERLDFLRQVFVEIANESEFQRSLNRAFGFHDYLDHQEVQKAIELLDKNKGPMADKIKALVEKYRA